jgi:hypothetical protein
LLLIRAENNAPDDELLAGVIALLVALLPVGADERVRELVKPWI